MKKLFAIVMAFAALCCSAAKVDTIALSTTLVPDAPVNAIVITPSTGLQAYPTAYLLNGYSGCHNDWYNIIQPRLAELADLYGMVMVMPDGRDSWYWDSPADPTMKMETFITTELVPYIDANYPTIPQAEKRAITGLSMGGQGGLWLAMRHPDIFGTGGSTSGGVDIRPFPKNWKMAKWLGPEEENQQVWDEHAIVNLVPTIKPGEPNIIFDCGTDDFFYEVNENLHKALLEAKIPHDYISRPGNHSRDYWRNSILYQLLYFNEVFNR